MDRESAATPAGRHLLGPLPCSAHFMLSELHWQRLQGLPRLPPRRYGPPPPAPRKLLSLKLKPLPHKIGLLRSRKLQCLGAYGIVVGVCALCALLVRRSLQAGAEAARRGARTVRARRAIGVRAQVLSAARDFALAASAPAHLLPLPCLLSFGARAADRALCGARAARTLAPFQLHARRAGKDVAVGRRRLGDAAAAPQLRLCGAGAPARRLLPQVCARLLLAARDGAPRAVARRAPRRGAARAGPLFAQALRAPPRPATLHLAPPAAPP